MKLIIIDFDGTIVDHKFPEIGEPKSKVFEVMKKLQEAGFGLVLNTCREDEKKRNYLTEAVEFCRKNGIEFRSVNENLLEDDFREGKLRRKIYGHCHIDDKNLGGFPGWEEVEKLLLTDK